MSLLRASLLLILLGMQTLLGAACSAAAQDAPAVESVTPPLFGYYGKVVNCGGIYIRAASAVPDRALLTACERVETMLARTDVTLQNLRQRGVELHLIGRDQSITSLPEYRKNDTLKNSRAAAGIYSACGEENLLPSSDTPDLCTRVFAQAVMQYGFDAKLRKHIETQFRTAITTGLWRGAPAAASPLDYWAELTLWYLGGHGAFVRAADRYPAPGPQALRQYDPGGYGLLDLLYAGRERPAAIEAIRAPDASKLALSGTPHIPAELQLVNNSGQTLRLFWIDTDGQPRPSGELAPYNRIIKDTFRSQVWMIQDQRGVELQRFVVQDAVSELIAAD